MNLSTVLLIISLFCVNIIGQPNDYIIKEVNTFTIKGTSNLHDWQSTVEKINGKVAIAFAEDGWMDVQSLDVWIDIKSIKGSKGSRMDKITWKALKMDTYPRITYSLKKIKSIEKTDSGFLISANGLLSIAGTENPIELKVKVTLLPNGDILFESSKWLKMTDFNVDPPTAMFGALKTGDDISLDFKIRVSNN